MFKTKAYWTGVKKTIESLQVNTIYAKVRRDHLCKLEKGASVSTGGG
jgi:hypothetical protein